ncbi:MAG: P63C domain-containing protein [Sodalis sp. (in: enterobacteria)]|uniref:P63C domain-containing protein n=1 Tax=Sodalis sp. (in: enterobacteria) TaxID=1898979 RepID=UPI0039E40359
MVTEKKECMGRAKGGVARAESLTQEQRTEIAKKAAAARWETDDGVEVAKKAGNITIGDMTIQCAVLEDGSRVLSERAITKAFGGKRGGSHWKRMKNNPDCAYLPVFLSAKNIKPFINNELLEGLARRRLFKSNKGASPAYGIEASLLPKICNVYLKMRDNGNTLLPSQIPISVQADIVMRGLAEVGIVALVDEATGHIDEKRQDEYRTLFQDFIREQVKEYSKEFPKQFTDGFYRLYGLTQKTPVRHPQFFGKFTRKYIYEPLALSKGAVLDMLDEQNPVVYANGKRRYKMFQFLTENVGMPIFRAHLWQVVGILSSSRNKTEFDRAFKRAFPRTGTQMHGLSDEEN